MYKCNPGADISGTGSLTILEFPPMYLVERFGRPSATRDGRVSGIYVFTTDRGETFTVYDLRRTGARRGKGPDISKTDAFWQSEEPAFLYVGGKQGSNPRPFVRWLIGESELRMTRRHPTWDHRGPSRQFIVA